MSDTRTNLSSVIVKELAERVESRDAEIAFLRRQLEEERFDHIHAAKALRDHLAGHPVRDADEIIERGFKAASEVELCSTPAPTRDADAPGADVVREAAKVLLNATSHGVIDSFDASDPDTEALAVKYSGNRGDPVIQLEIAEEFWRTALRTLATEADHDPS